jgi:hypothetical protein
MNSPWFEIARAREDGHAMWAMRSGDFAAIVAG